MSARKPYVGGNWKMNLNRAEAVALTEALVKKITSDRVEVVICPPFPYLSDVASVLRQAGCKTIKLGAQDGYHQPNGAFTGEVSMSMLRDVGASVVLCGHSERRHVLGETDVDVNRKVHAALSNGLEVIVCVGETLEQRAGNMTDHVNMGQLMQSLAGVRPEQMAKVTVAYEPVWAIGTGRNATPADAQAAHDRIRRCVQFGLFDGDATAAAIAGALRIQYGGSVKASNAKELFGQPDVDGGLIGGASLKADEFAAIVEAAVE